MCKHWIDRQGKSKITAISEKYQIDITCIQEHRIHHPKETVKHQDLGNVWMIITSSAETAENNATIRGIGIFGKPEKVWKSAQCWIGKSKN